MEIQKRHATAIIDNLQSVIQEDINIISPQGEIIASTDPLRVGSFHEGALHVAKTLKPLEINYDNEFTGAKQGLNLPVFVEKNLVAIVGITGKVSEIAHYSSIIVKMSEILFREHLLNVQKEFKRENNRILVELIIKGKLDAKLIAFKMEELGYSPSSFRFVIVFEIEKLNEQTVETANLVLNTIEKRISLDNLLSRNENGYVMVSTKNELASLIEEVRPIKEYIEQKYRLTVTLGISQMVDGVDHLHQAYVQANTIVQLAVYKDSGKLVQFDPENIGLLLQSIPGAAHRPFVERVFLGLSDDEIEQIKETVATYMMFNGSINESANHLYIHKNTMQYRLNKVFEKTGLNPRELTDLVSLFLAINLYDKKEIS